MSVIRTEYLERVSGDEVSAAAALAFDLMQDDPASHKQGYSFDNAVIAAAECIYGERMSAERVAVVAGHLHRKLVLR